MKIQELCHLISLPQDVCESVIRQRQKIDLKKAEPYLADLMKPETAYEAYHRLEGFLGEDPDCLKMLACQLECAVRDYDRYKAAGISEFIFTDTMKCFTRFLNECRKKTGTFAFDRGWWTWRQISMTLFRLGELEYEMTEYQGQKAVAIHIPSDAVISADKIDGSLEQSRQFMKQYYPQYSRAVYFCESWLLSPRLGSVLKENSNILGFQKRFLIQKDLETDKEYIDWLFDKDPDTPLDELPESTSLQRSVKRMMENGINLGAGIGTLR